MIQNKKENNMFWILYLISIASRVSTTIGTIGWLMFIAYGIILMVFGCMALYHRVEYGEDDEDVITSKKAVTEILKKFYILIIAFIFIIASASIPSSKDLIIIFGITKFSQSKVFEQTNEITQKSLQLLNQKLDNYINGEPERNKEE
jgi:hypothetical protein